MNNLSQKQLLINYLLGICTPKEQKFVEDWLEERKSNADLLQRLSDELAGDKDISLPDRESVRKTVQEQIKATSQADSLSQFVKNETYSYRSSFLKIAALFLVMLIGGVIGVFLGRGHLQEQQNETSHSEP